MNKIKSFFEKKKLDIKFKEAGAGHSLSEGPRQSQSSSRNAVPGHRQAPIASSARAGEAALARYV